MFRENVKFLEDSIKEIELQPAPGSDQNDPQGRTQVVLEQRDPVPAKASASTSQRGSPAIAIFRDRVPVRENKIQIVPIGTAFPALEVFENGEHARLRARIDVLPDGALRPEPNSPRFKTQLMGSRQMLLGLHGISTDMILTLTVGGGNDLFALRVSAILAHF